MWVNNRCRWAGCTAIIYPDLELQPRSRSFTVTTPRRALTAGHQQNLVNVFIVTRLFFPAHRRLLCSAAEGDTHFTALEIIFSCTQDLEIANRANPSSLFYFLFRLRLDKYSSKASFIVISQRKCSPVYGLTFITFPGSSGKLFLVLRASRFNGFDRPHWLWKHPENSAAARFVLRRPLWLTDGLIAPKPSLKTPEQLEPIFPLPLPRGPDAGHKACWATTGSVGKLKFSAGRERGESFKSLVRTSLCSQHAIFLIRALAVSTHLLLSVCAAGGLFNSTSKSRDFCKASNSQRKQQESCSRRVDAGCHLSIKPASRIHVWHFLGN